MTSTTNIGKFEIDSLSGVYIAAGTFITYCFACLAIGMWDKYQFHKARKQRATYSLSEIKRKEREAHENHN